MTGALEREATVRQQFSSGRELINAVKARREHAQAFAALAADVDQELSDGLEAFDPELVEGVRVLWVCPGRAARDETAFRHALKTGHRLRAGGQRMTDAALIDAYEHAYRIAQRYGADGRDDELPPMRDRLTMARRVRGYVTQSKNGHTGVSASAARVTTQERKALATMGRRGGQKAAQRWKTDPHGEYAQGRRETLEKTHRKKKAQGRSTKSRISQMVNDQYVQTGTVPTWAEIGTEVGVSRATVARHIAALKKSGDYPDV